MAVNFDSTMVQIMNAIDDIRYTWSTLKELFRGPRPIRLAVRKHRIFGSR